MAALAMLVVATTLVGVRWDTAAHAAPTRRTVDFAGTGVMAFGRAPFLGSPTDGHLSSPINAVSSTPTGQGYWLAGADGGVPVYGDAGYFGSAGDIGLFAPTVVVPE